MQVTTNRNEISHFWERTTTIYKKYIQVYKC